MDVIVVDVVVDVVVDAVDAVVAVVRRNTHKIKFDNVFRRGLTIAPPTSSRVPTGVGLCWWSAGVRGATDVAVRASIVKYFNKKVLKVISCRNRVELVHKSSMNLIVGRTLFRVEKSVLVNWL